MESAFNAASVRVYIPETSSIPESLFEVSRNAVEISEDWETARTGPERDVAFFDEKLIYYLALFVPDAALESLGGDGEQALRSLVKRIQRTITSSFLPPVPDRAQPHSRAHTDPSHLGIADTPKTPKTPGGNSAPDPTTPNPFPATRGGEEDYADVEGVTVWEGDVGLLPPSGAASEQGGKREGRSFSRKVDGGHEVIWEGELPVAYVRTQIQNPLLALTASITLRPDAVTRATHRSHSSVATTGESVISDGDDEDEEIEMDDDEAGMMDIDLLGGLGGDGVPASRLGPSTRQDLSLPDPQIGRPIPLSALTPNTAPRQSLPPTASSGPTRFAGDLPSHRLSIGTTMRKSFRRVLSLSPGLRVRMRNLVLPQLIPPSGSSSAEDDGDEGEKKVALCVEIENAPDGVTPPIAFTITRVDVEIGGKGGKATASLTCQPPSPGDVFPLRLQPMEQYNLLYGVTVASASDEAGWEEDQAARTVLRNLGTGEVNRPVSIMVIGRPYYLADGKEVWPTREFSSRWNCNLDLSAYYASMAAAVPPPILPGQNRQRTSRPTTMVPPPNAIVGDKRYSLATLLAGDDGDALAPQLSNGPPQSLPPPRRIISGKPLMPSQIANQQNRQPSARPAGAEEKAGLMISVRLLDSAWEAKGGEEEIRTIKPLEEFSVEVYVNNRTEEVRRFRLSIPAQSGGKGRSAESPGVMALENDIRCGPLLPGASMSARLRFMALREGVHRIEKLRVTGVGDEVNFVVSPVLDVVVGSGAE